MKIIFIRKKRKALCLLLTGLSFFWESQAQTTHSRRKENFDVSEFKTVVIDIKPGASILQLSNIQGITVMDARADTASVGFMQKKVIDPVSGALNNAVRNQTEQRINRMPTFILLGTGLASETSWYLQRSIVFANDTSLPRILMVVKKLWLSDELNLGDKNLLNGRIPRRTDAWTSGIDIKVEFYLTIKGACYAMYRYDSTISQARTVSEYGPQFVQLALQLSLQRMAEMDTKVGSIMNKRKFSMDEIKRHNEDEFNLPILRDSVLKKGVYMTFEDFKNNRPLQTAFELKKEKIADNLYFKKPDGTSVVATDLWGYCDGKNTFIKSLDNFFILQRISNAFYIYGAKYSKMNITYAPGASAYAPNGAIIGTPLNYTTANPDFQLEPFQLDWITGKLY